MSRITISLAPGTGAAHYLIIAEVPGNDGQVCLVLAGTVRSISAGFWEADLNRATPESGPQGPEPGRGPMEHGRQALRTALERSANEDGPWWPEGGAGA